MINNHLIQVTCKKPIKDVLPISVATRNFRFISNGFVFKNAKIHKILKILSQSAEVNNQIFRKFTISYQIPTLK
jgi:hypothetical protein